MTKKNRLFSSAVFCIALALACPPAAPAATQRFSLYGLELPQPKSAPKISAEGRVVSPPDFLVAELTLEIDKRGKVSRLNWNYLPADSSKFEPYTKSIRAIKFHPARFEKKKITFTLNAEFVVTSRMLGTPSRLILPLDTGAVVRQPDLLIESAHANGFHPPELVSFPPYFYRAPPVAEDTALLPQIAALRIEIDENGSPIHREIIYASRPDLAEMILVASNWATYSAGDFRGDTIGGSGILLAQFFNEIKYPTKEWIAKDQPPSRSTLESVRIHWYPEHVELIQLPSLRRGGNRTVGAALAYDRNTPKKALIWVDSNGRIRVESTSGVNVRADRELLKDRIQALRFHPGFRLSHTPEKGYFPEPMFTFGAIHLAPLDSLVYEIQTDFSLQRFQFPLRAQKQSKK